MHSDVNPIDTKLHYSLFSFNNNIKSSEELKKIILSWLLEQKLIANLPF